MKTLLVCVPNLEIRNSLGDFLKRDPYQVIYADSLQLALELLACNEVDFFIHEMTNVRDQNVSVIEQVVKLNRKLKFIFLSPLEETQDHYLKERFNASIITRPLSREKVIENLEND